MKTVFVFLLIFFSVSAFGQCPGFVNARNPSAGTNILVSGSTPWQFCQQVYTSDDVYCGRSSFPVGTTQYLYVYDWKFSTFSGSSTICGVKIRMEKSADPGNTSDITDLEMHLWNGSSLSPNNYADPNPWPTADTYITYGGNSDLWGWGSITPAVANSVAFGLRFRAQSAAGANIAYIDHIEMTGHANEFLPVELLAFDALKDIEKRAVYFKWKCASETNNDFFTLERSKDNINWRAIATVKGEGTTSMQTNYDVKDVEPFPGESYYRLLQTDFDGTTKVLDMISVRFRNTLDDIQVYPAITNGLIKICAAADIRNSQISLIDVYGNVVKQVTFLTEYETFETSLDLSELATGVYFIRCMGERENITKKVIKL